MAVTPTAVSTAGGAATQTAAGQASYRPALTLLASLFFMWGFITVINVPLLPVLNRDIELR